MGKKGDKMTSEAPREAENAVKILSAVGEVSSRKMFGGFGLFEAGKMFGIIDSSGEMFLKGDDSNRGIFEAAGSVKHQRMSYYSVPDAIRGDTKKLCQWAKSAIRAAKT